MVHGALLQLAVMGGPRCGSGTGSSGPVARILGSQMDPWVRWILGVSDADSAVKCRILRAHREPLLLKLSIFVSKSP